MANRIIKSNKKHEERITFEKGQEISSIEGHLNTELGYLIEKGWVADKVENNERKLTLLGSILFISKDLIVKLASILCIKNKEAQHTLQESNSHFL